MWTKCSHPTETPRRVHMGALSVPILHAGMSLHRIFGWIRKIEKAKGKDHLIVCPFWIEPVSTFWRVCGGAGDVRGKTSGLVQRERSTGMTSPSSERWRKHFVWLETMWMPICPYLGVLKGMLHRGVLGKGETHLKIMCAGMRMWVDVYLEWPGAKMYVGGFQHRVACGNLLGFIADSKLMQ